MQFQDISEAVSTDRNEIGTNCTQGVESHFNQKNFGSGDRAGNLFARVDLSKYSIANIACHCLPGHKPINVAHENS